MAFIEQRSRNIFIRACHNLCEIEHVKEYNLEMEIKKEYKIIKLKESVLRDHILKIAKDSSTNYKNLVGTSEKKNKLIESVPKSGSQTARPKSGTSSSNLNPVPKKDNYLINSLSEAKQTFPKEKRRIVVAIIDKIIDKFMAGNFENWEIKNEEEELDFDPQYIFSYDDLLQILNKIIRTFPSTACMLVLFNSKRLKNFNNFCEFLVSMIYPMGFITWRAPGSTHRDELGKFEDFWSKDFKPSGIKYRVRWSRNSDWENMIVENMRTLIDFNCFMSPGEKKIKIEIKRRIIQAVCDKASNSVQASNLKMINSLATSLI